MTNRLVTDRMFVVTLLKRNAVVFVENERFRPQEVTSLWGLFRSKSNINAKPLIAIKSNEFSML